MNPALLIVDVQQDYFPKGRVEVAGASEASEAAKRLLLYFREKNFPVVHIQHISTRKDATFLLPNTDGINFHESVTPLVFQEEATVKISERRTHNVKAHGENSSFAIIYYRTDRFRVF